MHIEPLDQSQRAGDYLEILICPEPDQRHVRDCPVRSGKGLPDWGHSPADDGTGAPGNKLYVGWTEVGMNHADLHLNASLWLAKKDTALANAPLILSAQTLSFGDVGMNDSMDVILKVTNASQNPLIIDSIYTSTAAFKSLITNATVTTDTLNIVVRFFAKKVGTYVDTLFIRNNSDTSLFKVPLSGNSPFSIITITPQYSISRQR